MSHSGHAAAATGVEAAEVNAAIWLAEPTLMGNVAGYMAVIGSQA